jgi:hypothetical protein
MRGVVRKNPAGSTGGFPYSTGASISESFEIRFDDKALFKGRIMALEGRYPQGSPPQIMVLADDRMQDLRMTRRTRGFSQSSDADVFGQIASDHGLRSQIDVSGGATYETLAQINQSDLALRGERAPDAEVWADYDTLARPVLTGRAGSAAEIVRGWLCRPPTPIRGTPHLRSRTLDVAAEPLRERVDEAAIRGSPTATKGARASLRPRLRGRARAHRARNQLGCWRPTRMPPSTRAPLRRGHGIADRCAPASRRQGQPLARPLQRKYYRSQVRHPFPLARKASATNS